MSGFYRRIKHRCLLLKISCIYNSLFTTEAQRHRGHGENIYVSYTSSATNN
jgi:hypothetical protein